MKPATFMVVILTFTTGLVTWHLLGTMAIEDLHRASVSETSNDQSAQVEQAEFEARLAQDQLLQFRLAVAAHLPESSGISDRPDSSERPLRDIASLARVGLGAAPQLDQGESSFAKGQRLFREKRYHESMRVFRGFVEQYPWSLRTVDSYFLWAESAFQAGQIDDSIAAIESMVELFPDNERTGFALLRLGEIYETKERDEDAAVIYRLIVGGFNDQSLVGRARERLAVVRR